jgi:hypothetical protein
MLRSATAKWSDLLSTRDVRELTGNSHPGNHRNNLPFISAPFATLEIETNSAEAYGQNATTSVAFRILTRAARRSGVQVNAKSFV